MLGEGGGFSAHEISVRVSVTCTGFRVFTPLHLLVIGVLSADFAALCC